MPCALAPLPPRPLLCRQREASPELAAALRGVKAVKLYLGFSAVQDRRTFEELADEAREEAIALVLLLDSDLD